MAQVQPISLIDTSSPKKIKETINKVIETVNNIPENIDYCTTDDIDELFKQQN